ncbi:MAG: HAD family hydrolase [Chloroflexi bacterium]|nr:HAD family hydrolase [Chloroflexota bacterium]
MIYGIIFDLGSTLMYLDDEWKDIDARSTLALVEFLHANGVPVGDNFVEAFRAARSHGWELAEETNVEHTLGQALTQALSGLGYSSLDGLIPRAVEQYFALAEIHWTCYPGALDTLHALKERGLRVGVISNADDDGLVQRTSVRLGFSRFADPVISSAGFSYRKPDPRIFQHVARIWSLPPEEIAMVGDAPRYDIIGAHRAGMKAILIDHGENAWWQSVPAELANEPGIQPDAVVHSLLEIPTVLGRL